MRRLIFCFLVMGCSIVDMPRTPQQKNLIPSSLDTITDSIYEDDSIEEMDVYFEREDEEPISPNFYRKVSITVSKSMNLRDVFIQLAKKADVNVFIPHDVEGGISFEAKNRPFIDILKDICSSCVLKYSIKDNSVKIENDTPSTKIYSLQFLNIERETQSSVSTSTDVFMNQSILKNSADGATDSKDNGSSSTMSGVIKNDFWAELEQNLQNIVGDEGTVTVHKQGGLVTVQAPQFKHEEVQKYINLLKDATESQVLIEAKILEVHLKDTYKNGINWNILRADGTTFQKRYSDHTGLVSFGINKNNLNAIAGIIEKFGAVKTLSSPRITVLNNQSAILKVAHNEIVCLPEIQRQYGTATTGRDTDFMTTTLHTIPIGLIVTVQPSIDAKNNTILLNLRPTISRIREYKEIPYPFQSFNRVTGATFIPQSQKIPIVDMREMDSVLKLTSGQVAVMGGLMKEESFNGRSGLPWLSELDPVVGENEKSTDVTELVIFLKATILRNKKHHAADRRLYEKFANDPRPINFEKNRSKSKNGKEGKRNKK
ncbi:MAG: secretin N-terminal domain-containing protein [Alphaproteobacteria bacterium]|nr:secretin N-terminal domain-containing protein [Alphaproteobacteria bacterium]